MTKQEINAAVSQLINIAIGNNPNYIVAQLNNRGNNYVFTPTGIEMEAALYKIYKSNPQTLFRILEGMPYDSTKVNDSTSPETIEYLQFLANKLGIASPGSKFDLGNIWGTIVASIGGQSTTTQDPTIVTTETANIGAVIGLVAVAGLAVFIVYVAFFKK